MSRPDFEQLKSQHLQWLNDHIIDYLRELLRLAGLRVG